MSGSECNPHLDPGEPREHDDRSAVQFQTPSRNQALTTSEQTTILVVEDEALIRMISADVLADAGFRVLEAENADEAIEILKRAEHVRLVFTDIRMPGCMDGLELAAFVHAHWPDVRLVVTSGHTVIPNSQMPDGGRFVSKPYDLKRLVADIRAAIDAPKSEPPETS